MLQIVSAQSFAPSRLNRFSGAAEAPTVRDYANGVRVTTEGKTDVYELPAAAPGVPKRITVEHRPWWKGGTKISATDANNEKMRIREWDTKYYVVDRETGITTELDRESMHLTVRSKSTSKTRPILNGSHNITQYTLEQHLSPEGDMRIVTNRRVEEKTVVYSMVRDMPANVSSVIMHDEDYEETMIGHSGEEIKTHRYHEEKYHERQNLGELPSRLDQSGDLIFTDAEGKEQVHQLFIAPHAMARIGG